LDEHIEVTPDIASGKPRIRGHRVTVQDIAIWHERLGKSADEIASEYDLTLGDVHAALAYYFDHREEIDARMAKTVRSPMRSAPKSPQSVRGSSSLFVARIRLGS
jgi:uncharacterized protein (DUF433 family)